MLIGTEIKVLCILTQKALFFYVMHKRACVWRINLSWNGTVVILRLLARSWENVIVYLLSTNDLLVLSVNLPSLVIFILSLSWCFFFNWSIGYVNKHDTFRHIVINYKGYSQMTGNSRWGVCVLKHVWPSFNLSQYNIESKKDFPLFRETFLK